MRKSLIVGNWKMNLDRAGSVELASRLKSAISPDLAQKGNVAVCPPFVYLSPVADALAGGAVLLGAQNVFFEPKGAFTGEVSAPMLRDIGARLVIIGHSERRHTIGHLEDDRMANLKVRAALAASLTPILCVGETLAQRQSGIMLDVLRFQTIAGLIGLSPAEAARAVIAYEPVWAIGTGVTATPDQAQEAHAHLRGVLRERFGGVADEMRILYGGSATSATLPELVAQADVDGGLVGGASLKADEFLAIVACAFAKKGANG